MKTKNFFKASLLVAALAFTGCSGNEEVANQPTPKPNENGTWTVTAKAVKTRIDGTRAISIGGNTGNTLYAHWDLNDAVAVYNSSHQQVGTLYAVAIDNDNTNVATLRGNIQGDLSVGEELTCYVSSGNFDFTGQKGTVADVSSAHTFMKATGTVTNVGTENFSMTDLYFNYEEAFAKLVFTWDGSALPVQTLTISSTNGDLIQSINEDGTVTKGDVVITPDFDNINNTYPNEVFVALRNENQTSDTYTFTVTNDDGIHRFTGTMTGTLTNGQYYTPLAPNMSDPYRRLSQANSTHLGWKVSACKYGHIFETEADVEAAGHTVVAVIFHMTQQGGYGDTSNYITQNFPHGLAVKESRVNTNNGQTYQYTFDIGGSWSYRTSDSPNDFWFTDLEGWDNTQKLIALTSGRGVAAKTAVACNTVLPPGTSGWYLPSIGQFRLLLQNLCSDAVGNISQNGERTYAWDRSHTISIRRSIGSYFSWWSYNIDTMGFWSSSEYDEDNAYCLSVTNSTNYDLGFHYRSKTRNTQVWPIFAF